MKKVERRRVSYPFVRFLLLARTIAFFYTLFITEFISRKWLEIKN